MARISSYSAVTTLQDTDQFIVARSSTSENFSMTIASLRQKGFINTEAGTQSYILGLDSAGKVIKFASSSLGNVYQNTVLTDGSTVNWDTANKTVSTALLDTNRTSLTLNVTNINEGTFHTLFVRKQNSSALTITTSGQIYKVGSTATSNTITLNGVSYTLFKIDFHKVAGSVGTTVNVESVIDDGNKGDITVTNQNTWTINNGAVTDAKILSVSWSKITGAPLFELQSNKGIAGGYASLDTGGKVPASQLPSYVDDVLEYSTLSAFPVTGEAGVIYVALDTNNIYRWSGSTYIQISVSGANTVAGTDTQVQFNDAGVFGADNTFTFDKTLNVLGLESIDFAVTPTAATAERRLLWDNDEGSLNLTLKGGLTNIALGAEVAIMCYNAEATTLNKGEVVYLWSAQGQKPAVKRASNSAESTSSKTFGMVAETIAAGADGFVMQMGIVRNIDTDAYTEGVTLYLGSTAGTVTTTKPSAPSHMVFVGIVLKKSATTGRIFVKPQNGYEVEELHNAAISSVANNDFFVYESSTSLWKNKSISTVLGYIPQSELNGTGFVKANGTIISYDNSTYAQSSTTLTFTGNVTGSGDISGTSAISIEVVGLKNVALPTTLGSVAGNLRWTGSTGTWIIDTSPSGGATSTYVRTSFTATASQTTFSGLTYTVGYIEVYLNGTLLNDTNDYTATNGTSVVLSVGANAGDIIETIAFSVSTISTGALSNSLVLKADSGTTEGTDLFTFDGSANKTLNIVAGSNITITKTSGQWSIASTGGGGGVTGTGTINEIAYFNATGSTIASLSTSTYPSLTELSYVKGVTNAIQTQINSKQNTLSGTGIVKSSSGTISYLTDNSTNWDTAYSNRISTFTTTGSSGSATFVGNTLNIPTYTLSGLGGMTNPMSALGDLIYGGTSGTPLSLTGNLTTNRKFLRQTGTGSASAAPVWDTILAADIPTLNQDTTGSAGSVANSFIIKADSGATEGDSLYTFDGSAGKTLNIVAGTNVTISKTTGQWTINASGGGGGSVGGSANQVQYNDGAGGFAGATNVKIDNNDLVLVENTSPVTPPANTVKLIGRDVASRTLPAFIGPSGLDSSLQPFLGRNKIGYISFATGATTSSGVGIAITGTGTATAATFATTNLATSINRLTYLVTTTSTSSVTGFRGASQNYWIGTGSGLGGFTYICRWGIGGGITSPNFGTLRAFVGLRASTSAPTDVAPNTLTNAIGMGWDSSDTNVQIYSAGTANSKIDTGIALNRSVDSQFFEIAMFSPPNTNSVSFFVSELNTSNTFTTTVTTSSNLPITTNAGSALNIYGYTSAGGTNTRMSIALASVYIETDY